MIGYLKGFPRNIKTNSLILDINGVGYLVFITLNTYYNINDKEIELLIHSYIKEDRFELYGFDSEIEKNMFLLLIRISGIGPSIAMTILSGLSVESCIEAIENNDVKLLTSIPGIGKSKADKIIFELKNKIKKFADTNDLIQQNKSIVTEACEALTVLGFDEKSANSIINSIYSENKDIKLEDLIKKSLSLIK